jgi:hypothetical protein
MNGLPLHLKRLRYKITKDVTPTGLYAIGTRITAAVVSFSGGAIAVAFLDATHIGMFLSFTSLAGFSAVADLGLTYSLLLATSSRPPDRAGTMAGAALLVSIPLVAGTGLAIFLGGAAFFQQSNIESESWLLPWAAYCLISSIQQVTMLALTYFEGTGRRQMAWRANFLVEIASGAVFVVLIAFRQELWALAASALARTITIAAFIGIKFEVRELALATTMEQRLVLWREQIWPMQWKTSINNFVGLITTRLLTPILLANQGAAVAGRMGLVLTLGAVIMAITSAWPLSQASLYTSLYYVGRGAELLLVFKRTLLYSLLLALGFTLGAGVLCEVLINYSLHVSARLPPISALWLILGVSPVGHITYSLGTLLRSQRRDPVVLPNLCLSIPTVAAYWYAAHLGPMVFSIVYMLFAVCYMMLYGVYFLRFMKAVRATQDLTHGS